MSQEISNGAEGENPHVVFSNNEKVKRLQEEILQALAERAVRSVIGREREEAQEVTDAELEASEKELDAALAALDLSWEDVKNVGGEVVVEAHGFGGNVGGIFGSEDDRNVDPVLEAKVHEYYHAEPSVEARLFLLNVYNETVGQFLLWLEKFSGEELYIAGVQSMESGGLCTAYALFSFSLLKGCDAARSSLVLVAELIRRNDRIHKTENFTEIRAYVDRGMRFARRTPSS